jgi:hypothetical protein
MFLSSTIGPNLGPRLHGYPLQFQQTNLKETWVDLIAICFGMQDS